MAAKRPNNISKYKKPININIGVVIFGVIFAYIIYCIFRYFTSTHIVGYEVVTGSLSVSSVYQGIALRKEEIVPSANSGYINYFARESEHVAVGDLVYAIDQSGKIADLIETEDERIQLSDSDLNEIRNEMMTFRHSFNNINFKAVYDFKYDVKGTALKLSNHNMLDNIDSIGSSGNGEVINFCNAPMSGAVVYSVDGFETLNPADITMETFDFSKYEKSQLIGNELVNSGDSAYKLVTDENWSIVIPVTAELAEKLYADEYIQVKFLKNQNISWGKVNVLNNGNEVFVKLDFTNSMIAFATDRFIDIELLSNEQEGLKIPNSAIVEREFYLIPKEYLVKGGNSSNSGFMRESYTEDGEISTEFIETTIYSENETDYYIDTAVMRIGDYICKPDSTDKYPISKTGALIGVYNINKGYADFKEITVLYGNEEYSIVKSNTQYGLSVYDHIVLEAGSVTEDDFVSE